MKTLVLLFTLVAGLSAHGANYKYNELIIKDYDEMQAMVQNFVKKAQKATKSEGSSGDGEAIEHLREAVKLMLSRPDTDNMIGKLMPEVRRDLIGLNAFEDSLSHIAVEAIEYVKNTKNAISAQATSVVILENLLLQINPEIQGNSELRRIAEKVREAKLKISDEVKKDRKLRGMLATISPSEIADEMLKKLEKQEKEKAKQKAKEEKVQKEDEQKAPAKKKKIITDD